MNRASVGWPLAALALTVVTAHLLVLIALTSGTPTDRTITHKATTLQVRTLDPAPASSTAPSTPPERARTGPATSRHNASTAPTARAQPAPSEQAGPTSQASPPGDVAEAGSLARPAPLAGPLPPSMRLRYEVSGQQRGLPVTGHAELAWQHDGQRYEATHELIGPALRSRSQRSTGALTAQGLAPLRFADRSRHEEAVHFDRAAGRVVFSSNRPDAALMPGAQDRLSLLLQLGAILAGNPAVRTAGTRLAVQTATTREAEPWHFNVEGEERLQLPGGFQNTLKLVRLPQREFDSRLELWLAPALDYVPVRLRLTLPGGDWLEQRWAGADRS